MTFKAESCVQPSRKHGFHTMPCGIQIFASACSTLFRLYNNHPFIWPTVAPYVRSDISYFTSQYSSQLCLVQQGGHARLCQVLRDAADLGLRCWNNPEKLMCRLKPTTVKGSNISWSKRFHSVTNIAAFHSLVLIRVINFEPLRAAQKFSFLISSSAHPFASTFPSLTSGFLGSEGLKKSTCALLCICRLPALCGPPGTVLIQLIHTRAFCDWWPAFK